MTLRKVQLATLFRASGNTAPKSHIASLFAKTANILAYSYVVVDPVKNTERDGDA
jgi:hypothetical protein